MSTLLWEFLKHARFTFCISVGHRSGNGNLWSYHIKHLSVPYLEKLDEKLGLSWVIWCQSVQSEVWMVGESHVSVVISKAYIIHRRISDSCTSLPPRAYSPLVVYCNNGEEDEENEFSWFPHSFSLEMDRWAIPLVVVVVLLKKGLISVPQNKSCAYQRKII